MNNRVSLVLVMAILLVVTGCSTDMIKLKIGRTPQRDDWTGVFNSNKADFTNTGRNPYFILEPGYRLVFQGEEDGTHVALTITVLNDTEMVDGVMTRIVEERETHNGDLVEISRNYFALNQKTGAVFYFGEEVNNYEQGKIANHEGSWRSGLQDAKYGLVMPGLPLLGARFYQERARGIALDRAEIVSVTEMGEVPAGKFDQCVRMEETTPLEPGVREYKVYAPGVGLIMDGTLNLTEFGFNTE